MTGGRPRQRFTTRARTGEIALGRTVVRASVPEEVHRALEAAISRAWHQGGDVLIVSVDGRQLSHDDAIKAFRALVHAPARRDARRV